MTIYQVVVMDKQGFIKEYMDFTSKQFENLHTYLDAFLKPDTKVTIIPYEVGNEDATN